MNRIYRIIRKAFSGEAVVVSELAKSRGKSHACAEAHVDKSGNSLRGIGFRAGIALLLAVWCTSVFAQQQVYDNSNPGMLESASNVGSGLPDWTGVFSAEKGLVYRSASNTVDTGADLLIDYTTAPVPKFVIGGYSGDNNAEVRQNTVTLRQGNVDGPVWGGLSQQTNRLADVDKSGNPVANDNSVLSQMTLFNLSNQSSQNAVNVGNDVTVTGDVYASNAVIWLQSGTIRAGNAQTITNLDIKANTNSTVWAGSVQAIANDSVLSVGNNTSLTGNLTGGSAILHLQADNATSGNASSTTSRFAEASAESVALISGVIQTASDNEVTLGNGSSVTGNIHGGAATLFMQAGDTTAGNAVSTGGRTSALANSYASTNGIQVLTASNNEVTVGDNASVNGNIHGGHATLLAQAGDARAGDANSPQGTGIFASAGAWSNALAGDSKLTASSNVVTVGEGSSVTGDVYGGYTALDAKTGTATAGHADTPMSAGDQNVARAEVGINLNGSALTASDNKVTVKNGSTVGGDIAGGFAGVRATGGTAIAGYENGSLASAQGGISALSVELAANDNEVTMNGTLSGGSIYGGSVVLSLTPGTVIGNASSSSEVTLDQSKAMAVNNTVTIGENAQINSPSGKLYGGYLDYNAGFAPKSFDVFSGNTLNYSAKASSTVQSMGNFQNYNFTINPAYANTGTALINAQDVRLGADASNVSTGATTPSKITVVGIHSGNVLHGGDTFVLMEASNSMTGTGTADQYTTVAQAQQGISLLYDVETIVDTAGKIVTARILGGCDGGTCNVNPQLKSLSEGYLLGTQLVMRGADMIADEAFKAIHTQNNGKGYAPFAILSGQHNRYNSGSHITSNDFLMTGGLSYRQDGIMAAAFVEAAWGNYDTFNSFASMPDVRGDGNDRYYGLGVLGRYDFMNGIYTEGSLRFGQNRNKFNTGDIRNAGTGEAARFHLKSGYASAHVGLGYVLPVDEKNQLDLSGKFLWTRLGGKNAVIGGDDIHFDSIHSQRLRVNGEWQHRYSNMTTLRAGLGVEFEFDSKAKATTYDCDIDSPDLRGGTGILSLGATVRPVSNQNLTLDFTANGYVGKREGASASVKLNYAF